MSNKIRIGISSSRIGISSSIPSKNSQDRDLDLTIQGHSCVTQRLSLPEIRGQACKIHKVDMREKSDQGLLKQVQLNEILNEWKENRSQLKNSKITQGMKFHNGSHKFWKMSPHDFQENKYILKFFALTSQKEVLLESFEYVDTTNTSKKSDLFMLSHSEFEYFSEEGFLEKKYNNQNELVSKIQWMIDSSGGKTPIMELDSDADLDSFPPPPPCEVLSEFFS